MKDFYAEEKTISGVAVDLSATEMKDTDIQEMNIDHNVELAVTTGLKTGELFHLLHIWHLLWRDNIQNKNKDFCFL